MLQLNEQGLFQPSAVVPGSRPATVERGYQSNQLPGWGAFLDESNETNAELAWPFALEIWDRMRREDPQVASVLRAVTTPIRRTPWMIDPAGARGPVVEHIARNLGLPIKGYGRVRALRTRGRFSFEEHLRHALLQLVYGHSYFEQVCFIDGGLVNLRKLGWRPPRSISRVVVARDGGLEAIEQHGVTGADIRIPVTRLVGYVNDREGANWLGMSLLRTAYKMWLLKDRGLRTQALTLERNGLGVPVYEGAEMPESVAKSPTERDNWQKSERDAGLKVAKEFRAGEGAGASIPHSANLTLKGVDGRLPDTDKPIRYYDEQIARSMLANFLNLGGDSSKGSYALGATFEDFFTGSLNALSLQVADVMQQHVVEDLVDWNWGESEPAPRIVAAVIGEDEAITPDGLGRLIEAGVVIPDAVLEEATRSRYRLPAKDTRTERVAVTLIPAEAPAAPEEEA
ncbi:phage portal protein family protein [Microbacterium sp. MMO-56]|uniref:phage portal protein family protein n=1 Tax=Microbacterium sp. MMO-56 TaxID=3081281 RepID=UPI003017C1B7